METHDVLPLKYRPPDFDLVLGQKETVSNLRGFDESGKWPHAFLFSGPSGCGKTTLARIIAKKVGCAPHNLLEIDAAVTNGIDAMRDMIKELQYGGFGESTTKVVLMDECHALSKQSWQSLLKIVEEPPNHVYFIFCTTELDKVPATIKTRTSAYALKSVSQDDLIDLVRDVAALEEIDLPENGPAAIALAAEGSPRKALTYLSQAIGLVSIEALRRVLELASSSASVIDLARLLSGQGGTLTWSSVQRLVKAMDADTQPESARIVIVQYLTTVILNAKQDDRAGLLLERLDSFIDPYPASTGWGPLLCSCAHHIVWS